MRYCTLCQRPAKKRLTEREIEKVVEGFSSRRAFGKGSRNMGGAGRGEVFRYGEFMASVNGGGLGGETEKASMEFRQGDEV